ncbi:MAG: hypothetical protein JW769_00080 [Parachlamydiales bacterium]|nr:hypothetical protein [Parachlamydiales bacterium]
MSLVNHIQIQAKNAAHCIHTYGSKILGQETMEKVETVAQSVFHFISEHKAEALFFTSALIGLGSAFSYYSTQYWGRRAFQYIAKEAMFDGVVNFAILKTIAVIFGFKFTSEKIQNAVYYFFGALNIASWIFRPYAELLDLCCYSLGLLGSHTICRLFQKSDQTQETISDIDE